MKIGNVGELATQLELAKMGYEIYSPAVDNASYDMLVVKDDKILRVEVKSTSVLRKGNWVVQIKKVRANKSENKIYNFDNSKLDILAVYIAPLGRVILLDAKSITSKSTLSINLEVCQSGLLELS